MAFGEVLRQHRRRLSLTQEQLSARTGLSVRSIRDIETNRVRAPRPATVRTLADALFLRGTVREQFRAAAAGDPPARPGPARPLPAQLPADVPAFTGRAWHLDQLDSLLGRRTSNTVVITAIEGTAGIGKTSLAVHWAHRVADRFPDGQLYVNLRGFGGAGEPAIGHRGEPEPGYPGPPAAGYPGGNGGVVGGFTDRIGSPVTPAEAVRGFLDAFEVPPQGIPVSLAEQVSLYRSLLSDRRVLVVLDNARDADQVRPLLPDSPGCLVVVTSRNQLSGLVAGTGAHRLTLDLLSPAEARQLLARRLGADRVAAEPGAVDEIIALTARLPLALAIVAARAATHPGLALDTLAAELGAARTALDPFADTDAATDVRAVFSWSYHLLSPPAARLFRLLGLHPGPDVAIAAAAALAGLAPRRVRRLVAELTRAHLLTPPAPGRYTWHDLLRAYAAELARTTDPELERQAAVHRVLDHYLRTAHAADRLLDPYRQPISLLPPRPGSGPQPVADHEQALAWFTTEQRTLLAAVDHAAGAGLHPQAWRLAWTLSTFLYRQGHWHELTTTQDTALDSATRCGDRAGQAHAHRELALGHARLGRFDDAYQHLEQALAGFRALGDHAGQAYAQLTRGFVLGTEGRPGDARTAAAAGLALYRQVGHQSGQARALNNIGFESANLGEYREALDSCRQALAIQQQLDDLDGQAATWDSIGFAHHHLGDHSEATACYQEAIAAYRQLGNRHGEAETLDRLGDTRQAAGDPDAARQSWHRALDILVELNHPDAEQIRAKLAG